MRIENGMVVLERKACHCGDGTQPVIKWRTCTKCKGTGRRGSGQCRECNPRDSYRGYGKYTKRPGYVWYADHDDRETCEVCNGDYKDFKAENYTDKLPNEVFETIPIEVVRTGRVMGWQEQHLGAGIYTSIDYGQHKNFASDELIAMVREKLVKSSTEACKMVKNKVDYTLATGLQIITGNQGYSVIPTWKE